MTAGDAQLRFEVLGLLRVRRNGDMLALGGPKPRALLGTLLLHPDEPVGVDQLTEALWDGEPPASATVNLRAYVRTLRRALDGATDNGESRLQTRAPGYLIRVEPGELDLLDFEELDTNGRRALERGDTAAAARLWRQALDLWRGRALDDIRGGPRLNAAVVRLEERRLRVAEAWIDAQLALGAHAELVSELRGMVETAPLHEPLWARLIVALHRTGRTADALAAYRQARDHLIEELGVEPSAQLQRLQRAILAGDAVVHVDEAPTGGQPPPSPVEVSDSARPIVDVCPYQGLLPFDTTDAEWFFGRERLVAELVTYLSSHLTPPSMIAVVGPSGSGKSSLLRAGLLPAFADGVLRTARNWPQVVLTPGTHPLVALGRAVAGVQIPGTPVLAPDDLVDPQRLPALVGRAFGADRRMVLVVDQLEELFMVCRDERARQAFVTALCNLAGYRWPDDNATTAPAVVVLGLRADFYGQCISYPELIPVLAGSQLVVGPMTAAELRHAITRPATRAGLTLEPGLVDVLLADSGVGPGGTRPEPGALPLLSHALLATWQLRDGHRLTLDGYRKAGGVQGAIATTAEAAYDRLEPAERTVARRLFTRLVALGDDTVDTSRRVQHDELLDGRTKTEAIVREVLDALAQARLIVLGADTVELAHEALISRWPRLQQWLTEQREGLRIHRALTEAAQAWAELGRDPGALYRGGRLRMAEQWAGRAEHHDDLNALERAFFDASLDLESSDVAAVRHRTLRSRQFVIAILVLVLLAVAGGGFALWHARRSAATDRASRSVQLARAALELSPARRPTAMLLAVQAYRTAPTRQARGALAALSPRDGYRGTLDPGGSVSDIAYSPAGDILAVSNLNGTISLWTSDRQAPPAVLSGGTVVQAIAFDPHGERLASGHEDGTVVVWDVAARARLTTLTGDHGPVRSVAFSPDGKVIAGGADDGTLLLWDHADPSPRATLTAGITAQESSDDPPPDNGISSVAFSPDGDILATGGASGALMLWDPAERSRLTTLAVQDAERYDPVEAVTFSPDGDTLAASQSPPADGDRDATTATINPYAPVTLWDVHRREPVATVGTAFDVFPSALAFAPDSDTLAMGTAGGVVLADVSRLDLPIVPTLRYSDAPVSSLAFSADGDTLAFDSAARAITLIAPSFPLITHDHTIARFAVSRDDARLATAGPHIDLWDMETKTHLATFEDQGYNEGDVAFTPDGEWIARGAWDAVTLHHVDGRRREAVPTSDRPGDPASASITAGGPRSLGFSGDPWTMFVADNHHQTVLVRTRNGRPSVTRVPGLVAATLSPSEDVLATTSASGVTLWTFPDMQRLGELERLPRVSTAPLVAFSRDGTTLATADGATVTLWDVAKQTPISSFTEELAPAGLDIAPDNRTVALSLGDIGKSGVALWDAVDRVRFAELPQGQVGQLAFSDNGTRVVAVEVNTIRFWDLDPQRITTQICATLDRNLTREEWAEFLPREPYRATCVS